MAFLVFLSKEPTLSFKQYFGGRFEALDFQIGEIRRGQPFQFWTKIEGRFESLDQNLVRARIGWWRRLKVAIRGLGTPKAMAFQPRIQGIQGSQVFTAAGRDGLTCLNMGGAAGLDGPSKIAGGLTLLELCYYCMDCLSRAPKSLDSPEKNARRFAMTLR